MDEDSHIKDKGCIGDGMKGKYFTVLERVGEDLVHCYWVHIKLLNRNKKQKLRFMGRIGREIEENLCFHFLPI
jgi:hypothetical protein